MKTYKLFSSIFFIVSIALNAQSWEDFSDFTLIGEKVLEDNNSKNTIDFSFNNANQPVVVYSTKTDKQLKVLRYDGSNWNSIGDLSFLTLNISQVDIEIVSNGDIFIAFTENNYLQLSIIKFDGVSWSYVAQNIANDEASFGLDLATDSNNNIYITFTDEELGNKVTVKKYIYSNQNIENIGEFITSNSVLFPEIKISPLTNEPYLVFNTDNIARVHKFDGIAWSQSGNDISDVSFILDSEEISFAVRNVNMAFSSNGELFVCTAEISSDFSYKTNLYVLNNTNWNLIHSFNTGINANLKLKKDNLGNIYLLMSTTGSFFDPEGILFIKFANDNYTILDNLEAFNPFYGNSYLEINIDNENVPFAIYQPTFQEDSGASHIRKFANSLSIDKVNNPNLTVFPNPSYDFININNLTQQSDFEIFDLLGKKITTGVISINKKIDITELSKGIYLLKIKKFNTFKIIKK